MAYSKGFQTWTNSMAILPYSRAAIITIFHHYVTLRIQAHVKHIGPTMVDAYFNGLFGSLKKERSRVERGRIIQLPCLEVF